MYGQKYFFVVNWTKNLKNKTKIEVDSDAENAIERYAEVLEHIEKTHTLKRRKEEANLHLTALKLVNEKLLE